MNIFYHENNKSRTLCNASSALLLNPTLGTTGGDREFWRRLVSVLFDNQPKTTSVRYFLMIFLRHE